MLEYLTTGLLLGLSAGLAPGPLLTLMITETLSHDLKVAKSRPFLNSRTYLYVLRGLGVLLGLFGVWLIWKGLVLIRPAVLG